MTANSANSRDLLPNALQLPIGIVFPPTAAQQCMAPFDLVALMAFLELFQGVNPRGVEKSIADLLTGQECGDERLDRKSVV